MDGARWIACGAPFAWSALAATALGGCSGAASVPEPDDVAEVTYVLLPHPDDEFQVWSQVAGREDTYTVFVLMTRGEQSVYCDSETGGGRWTDTCVEARLASWTGFFDQMGQHADSLPADFPDEPATVTGLDTGDVEIGRDDDGLITVNPDALVWQDADGRGALVAFDLGDGDLTEAEAAWAAGQVVADPGAFGLLERDPDRVLGAYYYPGDAEGCFPYPHPDHAAVAEAVLSTDLAPEQRHATCAADPDVGPVVETSVGEDDADAAFGDGGAFPEHYGWLGEWPLALEGQTELFHVQQAFTAADDG